MAGQDPGPQVTAAGAVLTVGALFRDTAMLHSNAIAIEYRDRLISYGELLDRVGRATAVLAGYALLAAALPILAAWFAPR